MGVDLKQPGQIRLARLDRKGTRGPVRLIETNGKRNTDHFSLYMEWMWVVEVVATGEQQEILEDDIKEVMNEMEAVAWAAL